MACSLTGEGIGERVAAWREALGDAEPVALPGGVRITVPVGRAAAVAGLAAAEQERCPFFDFRLHLDEPVLHLDVRAPQDAAPLVADLFGPAA